MSTILHLPRMAQRVRAWAHSAADRASDPDTNTDAWRGISARLHRAAQLYADGRDDHAAAIVDDVVGDLLHGGVR